MSTFYQPGRYRCEVTQQAMTKNSNSGNPQFVLKVLVLEQYTGPDQSEPCNQQYERTIYRSITDKSMEFFQKELDALGFTGGSLRQLDPNYDGFTDFKGAQVDCLCKHEADYKDASVQREKWSIAWATGASSAIEGDELAPSDYRALDALFGKAAKAAPKAATKPVAAASSAVNDDDVPF
ncbi:MAG: hypothetical protein ABFD89_09165 [Bryobacteraceae bacterium]